MDVLNEGIITQLVVGLARVPHNKDGAFAAESIAEFLSGSSAFFGVIGSDISCSCGLGRVGSKCNDLDTGINGALDRIHERLSGCRMAKDTGRVHGHDLVEDIYQSGIIPFGCAHVIGFDAESVRTLFHALENRIPILNAGDRNAHIICFVRVSRESASACGSGGFFAGSLFSRSSFFCGSLIGRSSFFFSTGSFFYSFFSSRGRSSGVGRGSIASAACQQCT